MSLSTEYLFVLVAIWDVSLFEVSSIIYPNKQVINCRFVTDMFHLHISAAILIFPVSQDFHWRFRYYYFHRTLEHWICAHQIWLYSLTDTIITDNVINSLVRSLQKNLDTIRNVVNIHDEKNKELLLLSFVDLKLQVTKESIVLLLNVINCY